MTSELTRYFLIDTNVLIHSVDLNEGIRAQLAANVIRTLVDAGRAAVSTQVIVEFFDATTRRKSRPFPIFTPSQAANAVEEVLGSFRCIEITQAAVEDAVRCAQQYQMRIYDAQIWAVAKHSGIAFVLTENLPSQPEIEGVRYVNPCVPAFRLEHIGL